MEEAPLPDGRTKKMMRLTRCDSVHILAFPSPEKIFLLREFRPFYQDYIWMLPSGKVDKETDIQKAAQRELQEETGFRADSLKLYCSTNSTESIRFTNHIFVGKNLQKDPLEQDHDELIEVHEMSIDDAIEKVLGSPVVHTASAYALLRYARENAV